MLHTVRGTRDLIGWGVRRLKSGLTLFPHLSALNPHAGINPIYKFDW